MGRKSRTGGVIAKGTRRIQFEFWFEGVPYRPTLLRTPTEANLREASEQLAGLKPRITAGTFSFAEEFPEFLLSEDSEWGPAPLSSGRRRGPSLLTSPRPSAISKGFDRMRLTARPAGPAGASESVGSI
jgi:hypothetical protein